MISLRPTYVRLFIEKDRPFDAESEIDAFLATSKPIAELQTSLKCGTNCGSCLPELRRRIAA